MVWTLKATVKGLMLIYGVYWDADLRKEVYGYRSRNLSGDRYKFELIYVLWTNITTLVDRSLPKRIGAMSDDVRTV